MECPEHRVLFRGNYQGEKNEKVTRSTVVFAGSGTC